MRALIALALVCSAFAGAASIVSIARSGDAVDAAEAATRVVASGPTYLPSATVETMLVSYIGAPARYRASAVCLRGSGNLYDCAYRDLQSPRTRLQVRAEPGRMVIVRDRTPRTPSQ